MPPGWFSDEELVSRSRGRDDSPQARESLNELFERYQTRVALWCFRLTGDRESAADLAQEVFLKAYEHLDSFRGTSRFSTWLYSIARNHCFNYLKSRARRPPDAGDKALLDLNYSEPFFDLVETESLPRLARELINSVLDDVEKRVIVLHVAEEVPVEAITRLLKLDNPSGAKAYIVSAKRKLKRAFERRRVSQGGR